MATDIRTISMTSILIVETLVSPESGLAGEDIGIGVDLSVYAQRMGSTGIVRLAKTGTHRVLKLV